jgi:hypothetical protein
MKNILDKINRSHEIEATKLAKHEVDLSLASDISAKLDQGEAIIELFNKNLIKFKQLSSSWETVQKEAFNQLEVLDNEKTFAQKWKNETEKIYGVAINAAKELGVDKKSIQGLPQIEKALIQVNDLIVEAQKAAQKF